MPPRWLSSVLLIGVAVPLGWTLTRPPRPEPGGSGCALYGRVIEVRGRLVDGSGRPLGERGVLAMTFAMNMDMAQEAFTTLPPQPEHLEARTDPVELDWFGRSRGRATPEGRFSVLYVDDTCICYEGEPPPGGPPWKDRDGLHGMAIERPGAAPFLLSPPPHGTWTKASKGDEEDGPACVWDLGDVVVPDA